MNTEKPISLRLIILEMRHFGLVLSFVIPILWKSHKQGIISTNKYVKMGLRYNYQFDGLIFCFIHDINLYRSIDSHALIGNIGGYVGLCLGYNFLQVPALITIVLKMFKEYFKSQKDNRNSNSVSKLRVAIENN